MTRGDYIDLLLSLLAVLLGAVTIFLAVAALYAYYDIRRAAERMAEETTLGVIQQLSQGGSVSEIVPRAGVVRAKTDSTSKAGKASNAEDLAVRGSKEPEGNGV